MPSEKQQKFSEIKINTIFEAMGGINPPHVAFVDEPWPFLLNTINDELGLQIKPDYVLKNLVPVLKAIKTAPEDKFDRIYSVFKVCKVAVERPTERIDHYVKLVAPDLQPKLKIWLAGSPATQAANAHLLKIQERERRRELVKLQLDLHDEWLADRDAIINADSVWLMQQSPDTWHRFVLAFNYDYDTTPLQRIVDDRRCDRATAATIFFTGMYAWASYYSIDSVGKGYARSWSLFDNAARNLTSNYYQKNEFKLMIDDFAVECLEKQIIDNIDAPAHWKLDVNEILLMRNEEGKRETNSDFSFQEEGLQGTVRLSFEKWKAAKGY